MDSNSKQEAHIVCYTAVITYNNLKYSFCTLILKTTLEKSIDEGSFCI